MTRAGDRQIDELVYKLYGLTAEEIRIVKGPEGKNEVGVLSSGVSSSSRVVMQRRSGFIDHSSYVIEELGSNSSELGVTV